MELLSVNDLATGYDKDALIKDICLSVENGEIVTLVGPNGSGKTTILKTIAGLLNAMAGTIYLNGEELSGIKGIDRAKLMSVMLTEKSEINYATCKEVIEIGRYPYTGVIGKLSEKDREVVERIIDLVGIRELAQKEFTKLSDGQRQRVLLARALVQEPTFLVLDEPTSFLDVGYKIEFMNVLKKLASEKKIGILMSLHELDLAASVSDRIVTITAKHCLDKIGRSEEILSKEYIAKLFQIEKGSYSVKGGFSLGKGDETKEEDIYRKAEHRHHRKAHFLMVQGTMSSAGKSLVVAGLCRIFKQDGFRVAPFKSQNMALNSYITADGFEMGRAQVMQAEAAGIAPDVRMNPILLKPTDDQGSQVIVNGKVRCNMKARDYFEYKTSLLPDIEQAVHSLEQENDIIVIEGAGSPAEINLKQNDIVNMGMAKLVDAPVVLVGDIDRGGVFAQLLGTLELLEPEERARVKGLIVNKFRGDKTILDPGIEMLTERGRTPVVGVLPYMDINLEDEDSLTERFEKVKRGCIDIAIIHLPHISNFTDFDVFEQLTEVSVRYIKRPEEMDNADLIILPGSKNTISDMRWLREHGFEIAIKKKVAKNVPVFGICGGYQMLGKEIEDSYGVEMGGTIAGLDLLPVTTKLCREKTTEQVSGKLSKVEGIFKNLSEKTYYGYEIHMGKTEGCEEVLCQCGNVYGTYVHGFFDQEEIVKTILMTLADAKQVQLDTSNVVDYRQFKESQYEQLAYIMRQYLDMDKIYEMMGLHKDE